jgi:hypothetical protein
VFTFFVFPHEDFGVVYLLPEVSLGGVRLVNVEDMEGIVVQEFLHFYVVVIFVCGWLNKEE